MRKITADYHVHTTLSPDGHHDMMELCQAAIHTQLKEIVFTDHFEIYSNDFQGNQHDPIGRYPLSLFNDYRTQFFACQQQFSDRLIIKAGLELGQSHINPCLSKQVLSSLPFDYIIGSMHKIDNIDLFWTDYNHGTLDALQRRNLEEIYAMVDQGDFDCVGHLDLIRRYATKSGYDISVLDYPSELDQVLNRLISRNKGLELNTSGLRQPLNELIPNLNILKRYKQLGGEIITFASDSHHKQDLGKGLDQAREMALMAGFHYGALYTNRQCVFYPL